MYRWLICSCVLLSMACIPGLGVPGLEVPGLEFPEPEVIERLAATPIESPANPPAGVAIERWQLIEPVPDMIGVGPPLGDSPGEQLLLALTRRDQNFETDEQLTCAAHQLAEFIRQNGQAPTQSLLRFMVRRCGAVTPRFGWATMTTLQVPQLADARDMLASIDGGALGLWAVRTDAEWLLVAVVGRELAKIEPLSMSVEGSQVIVTGNAGKREWVGASINHGVETAVTCKRLASSQDGFRLACPIRRTDEGAYLDVLAGVPGQVYGELVARLWVSPDGTLPLTYQTTPWGVAQRPVGGDLTHEFVDAINMVRAEVAADPLVLVQAQSELLAKLHPHLREAHSKGDRTRANEIMLGLLAGTRIEEPILIGNFSELTFEGVSDLQQLVEAGLEQPSIRISLLNPEATRIALVIHPGQSGEIRAGMFFTYTLAQQGERYLDQQWLYDLLDLDRQTSGLPGLSSLRGGSPALAEIAKDIAEGKHDPQAALSSGLQQIASANPGHEVLGFYTFSQDVKQLEFPPELMTERRLELAVHVELVEPANSPWASLLILFAYIEH